jgi:LuxR family transcriptional regulator of spore coat protein
MSVALDPHLTNRETEITKWLSHGKTASEIGIILGISPITVTDHITSAMRKVGVFKSTALVAAALRSGLIQ